MIENITIKIKENSEDAFRALNTLGINLFNPFPMKSNESDLSIFENLIRQNDIVFFKDNIHFLFDRINKKELKLAENSILKFKNFESFNEVNVLILDYLYTYKANSLTDSPELYFYYTVILNRECSVSVPVSEENVYSFLLEYLLVKSSQVLSNPSFFCDQKRQVELVLLNIMNNEKYYNPEILNSILNELYLKDKKDLMNIILQIAIENDFYLTDILHEKVKNEMINYLNITPGYEDGVINQINNLLQELEENDIIENQNTYFNSELTDEIILPEEDIIRRIKQATKLSEMLKIESEYKEINEMMNRDRSFIYSLKQNITLMDLINENKKLKGLINKEVEKEEGGKKRL